ncbi:hypothetical protein EV702DRAFT_1196506 [Suillus placidus]|uniref:SNF2 N-terminal domain-containing protein n=1 Tax=Suillus placidus TaxID=48579 RepID=A0A9P6ZWH5_9AGAM|nr:hypothetical protein EV702DRAFT_1196506 [Suillus placidus]
MGQRIDEVWMNLGVSPMQLMNEGLEEGEDFPSILDCEWAKEDLLLGILGNHALEHVPHGDFREAGTAINHHAWEHHHKRWRRAQDSLPGKQLAAATAVKEIEDADVVTAKLLREATRAIKALSLAVGWFPEEQEKLGEYEEFLKEVVVVAVAKARQVPKEKVTVKTDTTPSRKCGAQRAQKIKTASLVAAGDVEEIWVLYVQLFETEPSQLEAPQLEEANENSGRAAWEDAPDDLGFPGGKPALFAEFRSKIGLCAWDESSTSKFMKDNEDMEPLSLLWHQRVGVAAIVNKIWSATKKDGEVPGILIADKVGVGKTALTMGFIAFVINAYWVQEVAAGRGRPEGVTSNINLTNVRPAPILAAAVVVVGDVAAAVMDVGVAAGVVASSSPLREPLVI